MADAGHIETDRILAELEKKLKKTYQQASKNAEGKFRRYMRDFVRKDEQHKKDVKAGLWSEKEYQDWRKNQLLYANTLNEIRDVIAKDLQHTDKMAIQMVRDTQPDVYAENYNYATYTIEQGAQVDTSFTMYDRSTVERLMKDDPQLLPKPSKRRQREIDASDRRWNRQKLQSAFTASILAGDSIPTMAKRISGVAAMDWHSAVRNARTMTTGAENGGRADSYKRAKELGIDVEQEWVATLDGRTRDSHREIDGERIKVGEKFSNGLRFPGDPEGRAGEVYNCRCTTIAVVDGIDPMAFDKSDVLQRKLDNADITYEEWKHQHREKEERRKAKAKTPTSVNREKVWSKEFSDSFKALGESEEVTNRIVRSIKTILDHRDGTQYEDLVYVYPDGTASINTKYNRKSQAEPSKEMSDMIKQYPTGSVIGIHNHPNSTTPSKADIYVAANRGYKYGIVVGHNGTTIKYQPQENFDIDQANFYLDLLNESLYHNDKGATKQYINKLMEAGVAVEVII